MKSIIKEKSFKFAVRIIYLYKYLVEDKREFILSKQLLKSGTSIGANVREALNGESKADFVHKLSIAQKECDETLYWLELLKETDKISQEEFESIYPDAEEILTIIRSIIIKT
ncbi:MAG: four helix bundle protein [bacterium]